MTAHQVDRPRPAPVVVDDSWTAGDHDRGAVTLLARARAELGSDTATLLLLDGDGSVLEPVAWLGLGRQARAAASVRIGEGFAGRVALTRQPLALDHVDADNVHNPLLIMQGLQTMLGVPVLAGERLLGVLHVGSRRSLVFGADEVAALQEVASEIARHVVARVEDTSHAAALTLQRSLLPSVPRVLDGLSLGARYVPADGDLGGDWYDVFELPGGRVGLVMGDVVGHGLAAAVVMGRLRSTLRAYALEHHDPAEVLTLLDRSMAHYESDALATAVLVVVSADREHVDVSCAGHPTPLLADPAGSSRPLGVPVDMMLGVGSRTTRRTARFRLPAGGALAMYTDGLVERRFGTTDAAALDAQVARFAEAFRATDGVETACSRILTELVGADTVDDDVALLVCRRTG